MGVWERFWNIIPVVVFPFFRFFNFSLGCFSSPRRLGIPWRLPDCQLSRHIPDFPGMARGLNPVITWAAGSKRYPQWSRWIPRLLSRGEFFYVLAHTHTPWRSERVHPIVWTAARRLEPIHWNGRVSTKFPYLQVRIIWLVRIVFWFIDKINLFSYTSLLIYGWGKFILLTELCLM